MVAPTEVSQLTIEYSGNQVECETTQINTDSSVYLAGCTVAGRSVENYTYGSDKSPTYTAYTVGNQVTYNNVDYYVIKDSGAKESAVTLLKAEPLSVEEVNEYGAGHVNRYINGSVGTAYDRNGYGGIAYYTSETCGYVNNTWVYGGCKNDYASSEIKYVVDAWKAAKAPAASEARLISKDEIETERKEYDPCGGCGAVATADIAKYNWMYNNNYWYWTNTPYTDSSSSVWNVFSNGALGSSSVYSHNGNGVVRPVITISKSNISSVGN